MSKHISWLVGFDFEPSLGYEKSISKMGTRFAHKWQQTQSCDNFRRVFEPYDNRELKIVPPKHIGDQAVVTNVGFSERIGIEISQGVSVNWNSHGDIFLVYTRYNPQR